MTYSRSLVTFAFVQEALEKGDIVTGLFPLFAPAIKKNQGKPFDPAVFAADLNEVCGLKVHPFIVEDWAPRMAQHNLLVAREVEAVAGKKYIAYTNADPDIPDVQGLEDKITGFFDAFEKFVTPLFAENEISVPNREVLERELVDRIRSMAFDDILSKPDRILPAKSTLTLDKSPALPTPQQKVAQMLDVVCASFFLKLRNQDAEQFELVTDLAGGALGAEVLSTFRVPPKTGASFHGMRIYLDSPLILDLLDVGSDEDRQFARYLLESLKLEGATVATFDHNVGEIVDVLTASNNNFERKQEVLGHVGARLRVDPRTMLRVKGVLANPAKRVRDLGIDITVADAIDRPALGHFSKAAEQDLLAAIRPFQPIEARAVDAASIASQIRYLYARRPKGGLMAHERLFVTKNTGLVRAALHYIGKLQGLQVTDPPILSDRAMAGTLWVASGGKGKELPLTKLLASCAAAVRPRRDVINKVREVLKESSAEDQRSFEAMIEDDRCGFCLMQNTLGDATLVTGESTPRLLNEMRKVVADEVTQQKNCEMELQRKEYEKKLSDAAIEKAAELELASDEISKTATALQETQTLVEEERRVRVALEDRLAQIEERAEAEERRRIERIYSNTRFVEWLFYGLIFLPISLALYVLSDYSGKLEKYDWIVGFGVFFLLSVVQFGALPNALFAPSARRRRLNYFMRRLHALGLDKYNDVSVDSVKDQLIFPEHQQQGKRARSSDARD